MCQWMDIGRHVYAWVNIGRTACVCTHMYTNIQNVIPGNKSFNQRIHK